MKLKYLLTSLLICLSLWCIPIASGQTQGWVVPLSGLGLRDVPLNWSLETQFRDVVPVWLDGYPIFAIAATDSLTAQLRAKEIQQHLQAAVLTPPPGAVTWTLDQASQQPVIYIGDRFLMTVTERDAQLSGVANVSLRAIELTQTLEKALARYQQERQPEFLKRQALLASGCLAIMLALSYSLKRPELKRYFEQRLSSSPPLSPSPPLLPDNALEDETANLRQRVDQRVQKRFKDLERGIARVIQIVIWLGGTLLILGLFPYARALRLVIFQGLKYPCLIAAIILLGFGLIRVSEIIIDRLFLSLHGQAAAVSFKQQRLNLRFSTFSQVTKSVVATGIVATTLLSIVSVLGIDLGPLLAGVGIIGLALSLASQNLLKDIINGFMILIEDQYGVGDVVVVGDVSGFVETMNLRITQLRNEEGRLITIPNGQIAIVQNLSKEWSRVDLKIPVALESDIDKALSVIATVASEMQEEPFWGALILEPPLVLGVDSLDHMGAIIRIWIKTVPLKQWDIAREYRRRLKIAFDKHNILLSIPHQAIQIFNNPALEEYINQPKGKNTPSDT